MPAKRLLKSSYDSWNKLAQMSLLAAQQQLFLARTGYLQDVLESKRQAQIAQRILLKRVQILAPAFTAFRQNARMSAVHKRGVLYKAVNSLYQKELYVSFKSWQHHARQHIINEAVMPWKHETLELREKLHQHVQLIEQHGRDANDIKEALQKQRMARVSQLIAKHCMGATG
jgi:hypothetical protein